MPKPRLKRLGILWIGFLVALGVGLLPPQPSRAADGSAGSFKLSGPLKRDLLAMVKEPLLAAVEGRAVRTPRPNSSLKAPLPLVVSLYLNGQLAARTWRLEGLGPLSETALALGAEILVNPKLGRILKPEEWPQATFGVAVLNDLKAARDDRDIGPTQAAIVFYGLKQSVGLPSDAPPPQKAKDLLGLTCQLVGLRPGAWMTGSGSILTAQAAEALEK